MSQKGKYTEVESISFVDDPAMEANRQIYAEWYGLQQHAIENCASYEQLEVPVGALVYLQAVLDMAMAQMRGGEDNEEG